MNKASVRCVPAGFLREIAFHGLAFVPLAPNPGDLCSTQYQHWVRTHFAAHAYGALDDDAAMIATALQGSTSSAIHLAPVLFASIEAMKQYATRGPLLSSVQGLDPAYRAAVGVKAEHGLHWLVAALVRCLAGYREAYDSTVNLLLDSACTRLQPLIHDAAELDHTLSDITIELSLALTDHGRVFRDTIVVGVNAQEASDGDDRRTVVQLLHEAAVRAEPTTGYIDTEWKALVALSKRVQDTPWMVPHQRWLAGLNLRELAAAKLKLTEISQQNYELIVHEPMRRSALLSQM